VPIEAVIFDFDGLIIDTETPLYELWQEIYRDCGCELALDRWQLALGTIGGFDPFADLASRGAPVLDHEAVLEEIRQAHWTRCAEQPLLPGVLERLQEARALGLGSAVASSSSVSWIEHWLTAHALFPHVDVICGRDHVASVKPAPDLFLIAADRLGVAPDACVVFEDSANGVRAARAAGMRVVAVPNPLTRSVPLPEADLVLTSLLELTLGKILQILSRRMR
jgi:HAD superfamily hydrolase (TIGR01509 family)